MKKFIVFVLLALFFAVPTQMMAQKHRHHQGVVTATQTVQKDTAAQGVTAYSDTSSVAKDDTSSVASSPAAANSGDDSMSDLQKVKFLFSRGSGLMEIIFITFLFIFGLPVIAIVLIVGIIFKNRRSKYQMANNAVANGQAIPENLRPMNKQSKTYLWQRGIKNACLGLGLVCLFYFLDMNAFAGVGLLVFFFGVGQAIIAKTTKDDDIADNGSSSIHDSYIHENAASNVNAGQQVHNDTSHECSQNAVNEPQQPDDNAVSEQPEKQEPTAE